MGRNPSPMLPATIVKPAEPGLDLRREDGFFIQGRSARPGLRRQAGAFPGPPESPV